MDIFGRLPKDDLFLLSETFPLEDLGLKNANVVIVGANGFLGRWLSTYFVYLIEHEKFSGTLTCMLRRPEELSELNKHENQNRIKIVKSNKIAKEDFSHLNLDSRTVIIYAATSTAISGLKDRTRNDQVTRLPETILKWLPLTHQTFIHLSSGGIYQSTARELTAIPGNFAVQTGSLDRYVQEKIILENWTSDQVKSKNFVGRNPRLFAFYGPGLQLDRHFAISDFVKHAQLGKSIHINGNPANLRSYLYPTDAIKQILAQAKLESLPYSQIGSPIGRSLLNVAKEVGNLYKVGVEISSTYIETLNNYVPEDVPNTKELDFVTGLTKWKNWLELELN